MSDESVTSETGFAINLPALRIVRDDQPEKAQSLYVRNVPFEVIALARRRARMRGLSMAEYIERLVALHSAMLAMTEPEGAYLLSRHGLEKQEG